MLLPGSPLLLGKGETDVVVKGNFEGVDGALALCNELVFVCCSSVCFRCELLLISF